jgi:tetratricopeptide (TPR) repeat protein
MGKIFYKYRSDSEYTEQIFTSGQVFLSTAGGLNDPFECSLQEIGKSWIEEKVREMKQAGVGGFLIEANRSLDHGKNFFGLSGLQISELLDRFRGHSSIGESYNAYAQFILERTGHPPSDCDRVFSGIDAELNSVGIFSMATDFDHPLMWAHYAGEHTGVCIGFEGIPSSRMDHPDHFLPVVYSDSLPEMDKNGFNVVMAMSMDEHGRGYTSSFKIAFTDKTFQRAITTKSTRWSYEREWRYVEPYPGLFHWPGAISELTFGLRCLDERRAHYIQLAEEHVPNAVRLFQIQKKYGTSSLERVPFEKPLTSPKHVSRLRGSEGPDVEALDAREFVAKMERLIRQEKYGEVIFQTEENLKRNPHSPILLSLKGTAHGYAGQHDKALECFKELTENYPDVAQGWYQMSCAFVELGRHEEAVSALRTAFALDPNDASTALNLGVELLHVQDTPYEALIYLRRAEKLGHRRAHQIIADIEAHKS